MNMEDKTIRAFFERLQRIETRIVRGFAELGVGVTDDEDWCRVDKGRREIYLKGAGRSIKSIQLALANAECKKGDTYDVIVVGIPVGSVVVP